MSLSRNLTMLAAILTAVLAEIPVGAQAATLTLVGSSSKVCQLTGDTDWAGNFPTAAQTRTKYGLIADDLGFPVDSGTGPLFFLFGDATPLKHPLLGTIEPDDALGFTSRTAVPDSQTCLDLQLASTAQQTFLHPTVLPPIMQGSFNVPTGGVFVNNAFYAFFWTNHCALPGILHPSPEAPLVPPAPTTFCPQVPLLNSIGRSVLARGSGDTAVFHHPGPPVWPHIIPEPDSRIRMPNGFVYVTAATPNPNQSTTDAPAGIPVFGVARYRASIPYLAIAPEKSFANPDTWSFYAGTVAGNPLWVTRHQWESGRTFLGNAWRPPSHAEIYAAEPASERCVGEHSVTWNSVLQAWILLYTCNGLTRVEARTAPNPWGPWSPPTVLLSFDHDPWIICNIVMNPNLNGCGPNQPSDYNTNQSGHLYAPFIISRFTQDVTPEGAAPNKQARIYWLLSTWNPYQVVVMQSTLQVGP